LHVPSELMRSAPVPATHPWMTPLVVEAVWATAMPATPAIVAAAAAASAILIFSADRVIPPPPSDGIMPRLRATIRIRSR
jgi:hypothetical protein